MLLWYVLSVDIMTGHQSRAFAQVMAEVEALRQSIGHAKTTFQNGKDKQKAAKDECKKLEKEAEEFKNQRWYD